MCSNINMQALNISGLKKFCAEFKYYYIYGAGSYAAEIMDLMECLQIPPHGVCVTKIGGDRKFRDFEIKPFLSINTPAHESGFILAMREELQQEILANIAENDKCRFLLVTKSLLADIRAYMSFEPQNSFLDKRKWDESINKFLLKPTVILKRTRGLGDVLAFEPIARELKNKGYQILIATEYKDVFRYNGVADGIFGTVYLPKYIEDRCFVFDMTYAYAITPFKSMVDGYEEFIGKIFTGFSVPSSSRIPVYDYDLIHEHKNQVKKICVNNEATEWTSRIYPRDRMKKFISYLKNKNYDIYEIGVNEDSYLGVGKKCFGMELHDTVKLMSEMDLYVGLDNGLLHLAQSIHLPVFALFGCVCPLFRIHDWSRARVMWKNVDELSCAGCWSRRRLPCDVVTCDRDKLYCMDWTVDEVIDGFENLKYNNPPVLKQEMLTPMIKSQICGGGKNG